MTPEEQAILDLGQQIYLARRGSKRVLGDSQEQSKFIDNTIDWVNQFLPELETETDWRYSRRYSVVIDTAIGAFSYDLPSEVRKLPVSPYRDVTIRHSGQPVASFRLVEPDQIFDPTDGYTGDRATVVGRKLVLSRIPTPEEQGGEVTADVIDYIPRLSITDTTALDLIDPLQLVILGVMKNQLLSDPVKDTLVPTATQKYNDLLQKAVAENNATADANMFLCDDLSGIRGIW